MKDILGRELKAGDRIVYAATCGRSAALRIARVIGPPKNGGKGLRVKPETGDWWSLNTPLKETTLTYGERIYLIES